MTEGAIDYWIIEFSYDMLKIGINNVRQQLGDRYNQRVVPKLIQTDFLDIRIIKDLLSEDKVNLFLLLGNTLGNFPEDKLLNEITSVMHDGDFFLMDNQIKGEKKLVAKEKKLLNSMYNTDTYKEYLFSILSNANITETDGEITTRIMDYDNARNELLRQYKCYTVQQEFTFKKDKEVMVGNKKIFFNKGNIIPVVYSRKYTKNALEALLKIHFKINSSFYIGNQFALVLCEK